MAYRQSDVSLWLYYTPQCEQHLRQTHNSQFFAFNIILVNELPHVIYVLAKTPLPRAKFFLFFFFFSKNCIRIFHFYSASLISNLHKNIWMGMGLMRFHFFHLISVFEFCPRAINRRLSSNKFTFFFFSHKLNHTQYWTILKEKKEKKENPKTKSLRRKKCWRQKVASGKLFRYLCEPSNHS